MDNEQKRNYRQARDADDYRHGQNFSYIFWFILVILSGVTFSVYHIFIGIIYTIISFGLSVWWKTRIIIYAFLVTFPPIAGYVSSGWGGLGRGFILTIIMAVICWLNYDFVKTEKELEKNQ